MGSTRSLQREQRDGGSAPRARSAARPALCSTPAASTSRTSARRTAGAYVRGTTMATSAY